LGKEMGESGEISPLYAGSRSLIFLLLALLLEAGGRREIVPCTRPGRTDSKETEPLGSFTTRVPFSRPSCLFSTTVNSTSSPVCT
jgi:hypothetical protein